jgi:hypothetical protein
MTVPLQPKIYHIAHVDRLKSIISSNALWCDALMQRLAGLGTTIGMNDIKKRRLEELTLSSHPGLYVGQCVPFYFCPRSIMLYLLHQGNHPELAYRDGQGPIIHLEADLRNAVAWAQQHGRRWAFTLSNAGARYFEDRANLAQLNEINWNAVQARQWSGSFKEGKQAEFLIEERFPWSLVKRIGVHSLAVYQQVMNALPAGGHRPVVEIKTEEWYY